MQKKSRRSSIRRNKLHANYSLNYSLALRELQCSMRQLVNSVADYNARPN